MLQYYSPTDVVGSASLRALQQSWTSTLRTEFVPLASTTGCNVALSGGVAAGVGSPTTNVSWILVTSTVLIGPFGVPSDGERPPMQPCSGQRSSTKTVANPRWVHGWSNASL